MAHSNEAFPLTGIYSERSIFLRAEQGSSPEDEPVYSSLIGLRQYYAGGGSQPKIGHNLLLEVCADPVIDGPRINPGSTVLKGAFEVVEVRDSEQKGFIPFELTGEHKDVTDYLGLIVQRNTEIIVPRRARTERSFLLEQPPEKYDTRKGILMAHATMIL